MELSGPERGSRMELTKATDLSVTPEGGAVVSESLEHCHDISALQLSRAETFFILGYLEGLVPAQLNLAMDALVRRRERLRR